MVYKNIGDKNMCHIPTQPGIYWARKNYSTDWNYLVRIKGKAPFLSYDSWNLDYPDRNFETDKNLCLSGTSNSLSGTDPNMFVFGDSVTFSIYASKSGCADKPGLYEVFDNKKEKLAYIKGIAPYMSCWTWEIENDHKSKNNKAWNLSFVKYIEKPEII